jgi:uncharacterized membrane protein YsdA (DUF1294 family)
MHKAGQGKTGHRPNWHHTRGIMHFHVLKRRLPILMLLLGVLACEPALADIYKCIDADGTLTYSDEGCPEGTREVARVPEAPSAETNKRPPKVTLEDRLNRLLPAKNYSAYVSLEGVLGIYGLMSLVCFIAYYRDKRKALRRQWRTPESTLHLLELLGGWPGGLLAQLALRHKIKKMAYQLIFWSIVMLHGLIWAAILLDLKMYRAAREFMQRLL